MINSMRSTIGNMVGVFAAAAMVSLGAGCDRPSDSVASPSSLAASTAAPATAAAATEGAAAQQAPAASDSADMKAEHAQMNMFGGAVYTGEPSLAATAALIKAGGGAEHFSFKAALVSMLGAETVNGEVEKLTKQYGAEEVKGFIDGMDFAVNDAIKLVTAKGIRLPEAPADLTGTKLAKGLVEAGTAPDGTFWAGYLFDKALSHEIHNAVMVDIEKSAGGHKVDELTHKILNQAMYDVAQALEMKDVKLASLH